MTYSISKDQVISYPPSALEGFTVAAYEWIDNLLFLHDPAEYVQDLDDYVAVVHRRFREAGWKGDGPVQLIWVPPFALPETAQLVNTAGVVVWHTKQESDGTSWLLYPPGEWQW